MNRCRALLLLLIPAAALRAQGPTIPARAPGGVLTAQVVDEATGRPVGFALAIVAGKEQRVFANEAGRFQLHGLSSGVTVLRVQQIGYDGVTLRLEIDAGPGTSARPGLVVTLSRHALVLPEIVVVGDVCTAASQSPKQETEGILAEIFKNAERLLALQEDYPFQETYQEATATFDSAGSVVAGRVDTGRYDSRRILRYRRGSVTRREGPAQIESALYFQPSDLAREEFRRTHCFWYSGLDTLDGNRALQIRFAPLKNVRSIDWAGTLLIDSASMVLVRSEAHLANLPRRGTQFVSASCTLLYRPVFPTLITPNQARCVSRVQGKPPTTIVTSWVLIDFKFLQRTPSEPDPTRPRERAPANATPRLARRSELSPAAGKPFASRNAQLRHRP